MDKSHLLQHRRLPGRSSPQQEDLDFARETLLVLWMSESDVRQQCCCAPTSWSALSICLLRLVSSSLGFEKQLPIMEECEDGVAGWEGVSYRSERGHKVWSE